MSHPPLDDSSLRRAAESLARAVPGDVRIARNIVGEVLLAQARDRAATPPIALLDDRLAECNATPSTAEIDGIRPLAAVRNGPDDDAGSALVSALLGQYIEHLLESDPSALSAALPAFDWLELNGPYAPYSAARATLPSGTRKQFDGVIARATVEATSAAAVEAIKVLRRGAVAERTTPRAVRAAPISVAGELEGLQRSALGRIVGVVTGWALVRGAVLMVARQIFSLRRPATVSLEGDVLRVIGHTEILGRTLRTFDVRYPLEELVEIRRETRYPALPAAISVVALGVGAFFGARSVVEGAGVAYFPLIAIGISAIVGGLMLDLLLRAVFPGIHGACRVTVRARDARAVVFTHLAIEEIDRLLEALAPSAAVTPTG